MTDLIVFLLLVLGAVFAFRYWRNATARQAFLAIPETFIVFDLETTGLKPETHEIIEIGAVRVYRDRSEHDTYQALVRPRRKIPKKITEITGITQDMVELKGRPLADVLNEFLDFIGDERLVAFNADFDMAFLRAALNAQVPGRRISNPVSCALRMARRAWPGLKSYRLSELAKVGGLSPHGTHRALGDCERTMIVYGAAVRATGRVA